MNKIISIADNATETLDEKLFGGFMKKVTVWNYANISKQSYFSLSHDKALLGSIILISNLEVVVSLDLFTVCFKTI